MFKEVPYIRCKLADRDAIRDFAELNRYVHINGDMSHTFRTDGAVITFNNPILRNTLGRDNNMNNFEVAYKFTEETAYSTVENVEFYISEFGYITPVLVVKPVKLKGNTIDHISLSNRERFDELGLRYGDTIKVLYDIIPYATLDDFCTAQNKSVNRKKINFITSCPKCHSDLDLSPEVVQVRCENPRCPSILIGRVLNFCTNMRIANIGYRSLEVLYDNDFLKNGIRSLYKLKKKTLEIEDLNGFGRIKTRKMIKEIEAKRRMADYQLMGSIGINGLSIKTFQPIFQVVKFSTFVDEAVKGKFSNGLSASMLSVQGFGEKKLDILIDHFQDKDVRKEFRKLVDELIITETFGMRNESKGLIIFSGFRSDDLKQQLETDGWIVSDSWSNKASYLVIPNEDYQSSKVTKATQAGVKIVTVDKIGEVI
jgi:DNA ligase (NAD+)